MAGVPKAFKFDHSRRLHGRRVFAEVFAARIKKNVGPVSLFSKPNDVGHPRLGLSVPRAVGIAVRRNRIKRLIREAFRLTQHDWPRGYDVIVVVRRHEPLALADYQALFTSVIRSIHGEWERRERRTQRSEKGGAAGQAGSDPSC